MAPRDQGNSISSSLPQGSHEIARRMRIISAFRAPKSEQHEISSVKIFGFLRPNLLTFYIQETRNGKKPSSNMDQLGSEADASRKIDAVNPSTTNNNMADVLQGLTTTLAKLAKASETDSDTC